MTLQNRVAIITGASQGIGEAIARLLAEHGLHLVLTARNVDKLEALQQSLSAQYPEQTFKTIRCDVTKHTDVVNVVNTTHQQFGKIDILVNNAGVASKIGLLQESRIIDIDAILDTNLKGAAYAMHAVLPHMVEAVHNGKEPGVIININSIAGKNAYPFWSVYDASKFGLHALTEAVAEEQRSNGIRVVGIYPGAVDTAIWDSADTANNTDKSGMLRAKEVADAVLYVLQQPKHVFISDITVMPTKPAL